MQKMIKRARQAAQSISKAFYDGAVMVMSDHGTEDVPVIPTGSIGLDRALGVGGIPRGRIIEVYGPEASGKTTLTLNLAAQAQARGGLVAFIDAEHALDPAYARAIGVDVDSLLVAQPDSGEEALEIAERLVREANTDLIIIDSVAALVPRAEIEGEMGDHHMGLQARLMSQALRKLTPIAHKQGSTIVFVNQVRTKIGVMFGSPETTTGGRALRFYASVRLEIRRIGSIKEADRVTGNRARVKVVKNKVAPPYTQCEFDIRFGHGIDATAELIEHSVAAELLEKRGAWFSLGETRIGPGRARLITWLNEHPDRRAELEGALKEKWAADLAPKPSSKPTPKPKQKEPAAAKAA